MGRRNTKKSVYRDRVLNIKRMQSKIGEMKNSEENSSLTSIRDHLPNDSSAAARNEKIKNSNEDLLNSIIVSNKKNI